MNASRDMVCSLELQPALLKNRFPGKDLDFNTATMSGA